MTDHGTQLAETAQAIVAPGKGILAADESSPTIKKRFETINVESTEDNRRSYRELLFTTEGANEFIGGVILFDETLRQSTADGVPLAKILTDASIVPGIKVDMGAKALAGAEGEKVTEGLDRLRERLEEYHELGARFTKWRAVITIGDGIPSDYCIKANAWALGRYAALSVEQGFVPIVEPEVLMDGDHDIDTCFDVTERTLHYVYRALHDQRVPLEQTLLKPNMVLSAKDCPTQAGPQEVAAKTIECLKNTVPSSVPGIVFLSGGQTELEATVNLNAMNQVGGSPWQLSFSYGRALQATTLQAWGGEAANVDAAKKVFYHRARMNGLARFGTYEESMEQEAAA
ncbi:MAG: fructose-bisphosphate aldolase class I [Acidobacteria bacterium]|nr:fructose-bisphosphate aldolase class I [Acidobacteriota bacterium]